MSRLDRPRIFEDLDATGKRRMIFGFFVGIAFGLLIVGILSSMMS